MRPEEAKNCWEFMPCPKNIKEKCQVFLSNSGRECYMLSDIKEDCPNADEVSSCYDCDYYKFLAPKQ